MQLYTGRWHALLTSASRLDFLPPGAATLQRSQAAGPADGGAPPKPADGGAGHLTRGVGQGGPQRAQPCLSLAHLCCQPALSIAAAPNRQARWVAFVLSLQEWAELGELSAEVVQRYDDGELTEQGVNEALCDPVMYFVSVGRGLGSAVTTEGWERHGWAEGYVACCLPWHAAEPTRDALLQAILGGILMNHRPHVLQHLLNSSKVAGETEEQAAARWRDVAVSGMRCRSRCNSHAGYCTPRQHAACLRHIVKLVGCLAVVPPPLPPSAAVHGCLA